MLNCCSCWGWLEAIMKKKQDSCTLWENSPPQRTCNQHTHARTHTNRCNCTFTPTGGQSTRREKGVIGAMNSVLGGAGPLEWQLQKKTTVIWKILEKQEGFGRVQILTPSHVQWWCTTVRMMRTEAVDQLYCPRERGLTGKKKWDSLYPYFSCVLFML